MALRNPALLARVLAKSTSAIGEILVADALAQRGYDVRPTNDNRRQIDLLARRPKGKWFGVEVKTDRARRPTWFVRTCPDKDASTIWVFVSAPRAPTSMPEPADVQFFVLTVEETIDIWESSDWNRRNPTNGDVRRWQITDDALNAWHKLPD